MRTIEYKPTTGANLEIYRYNDFKAHFVLPPGFDAESIEVRFFRNGQDISENYQPEYFLENDKLYALVTKEQLRQLPTDFQLVLIIDSVHAAILNTKLTETGQRGVSSPSGYYFMLELHQNQPIPLFFYTNGKDGREVMVDIQGDSVVWKYAGETDWRELVALSDIQGPQGEPGREVQLQSNSTHIQWRYSGELNWENLVPLSNLQGPRGYSAYEVAAQNGYPGTLTQWLADQKGETGEISREELMHTLQDLGIVLWYGVEWNKTAATTACTRIGNLDLHKSLPIQNGMRGCLLLDNGTVNYYLDAEDWTKKEDGTPSDLTGAHGQVMVEIPEHYRAFEEIGNIQAAKFSLFPLNGFKKASKFYYAAFEASVDRSINKVNSVQNINVRGGNNNTAWDGTYRDLRGMPATNINATIWRVGARQHGAGWECNTAMQYWTICWLYYLEYANRNCQIEFNPDLSEEGFRQGGMGAGSTGLNATTFNSYNSQNPVIPIGYTNSLGNRTGTLAFTLPVEYPGNPTIYATRYRGIENMYGGSSIYVEGYARIISNGVRYHCLTDDPSFFSNTTEEKLSNWNSLEGLPSDNNITKEIVLSEGILLPATGGGSTNTFFADRYEFSGQSSYLDVLGVVGGSYAYSQESGLACIFAVISSTYPSTTSRLTYRPQL